MRQTRTLERLALQGEHGADWYDHARREIRRTARAAGWDPAEFSEVLALLSPRCAVVRNIRLALEYMAEGTIGNGVLPSVVRSVEVWEECGEVRGLKTSAFARALQGDRDAVTLDSWMARAVGVTPSEISCVGIHRAAAKRVRAVAESLDWAPAETQAAIWVAARTDAGFAPVAFDVFHQFERAYR